MIRLDNTSEQSIITMLRDNNVLNNDQVKQIENLSKESGKSQLETAFELNITNDTKIAELLSESFSIPLINLEQIKISKEVKKLAELRYLKDNIIIPSKNPKFDFCNLINEFCCISKSSSNSCFCNVDKNFLSTSIVN
mgnify:CR=1 FL=1